MVRECALVVFKHIEKTAGTTLVHFFHELAWRGELTYHSRWFHQPGQCATCRTASWSPECRCDFAWQRRYVLEQFEQRALGSAARWSHWMFLNDSTPRPWRAVIEVHAHDTDLPDVLHRAVKLRNGGCSVHATTVWRHPVAHWTSRYAYYVHNGWMHLQKGEPVPPLREWVRENPNDQTHDLLRGALRQLGHRIRNNDTLLHQKAMRTLRHFDLFYPIERLEELAFALCDALGIRATSCPRTGFANAATRPTPDPLRTGPPSPMEWEHLMRQYGAVDERLYWHAEALVKRR